MQRYAGGITPTPEEQAQIEAAEAAQRVEDAERARERRIADTLDRRDRLLAALALRASSGWQGYPPALRQRAQAVIDQAADRVRDLLA